MPAIIQRIDAALLSRVPAGFFVWFRRAVALKIFLFAIYDDPRWSAVRLLLYSILLVAAINAGARRRYWPGMLVLFLYKIYAVVGWFPYTINHHFFELLLLFTLTVLVANEPDPARGEREVDGLPCHVIQYAILSLFFFAGVHKIVHGYYLNGDMFAFTVFFSSIPMGQLLAYPVNLANASGLVSIELPLQWPAGFDPAPLAVPGWMIVYVLFVSWFVVLSEIILPPLCLFKRTRTFALAALVIMQTIIGVVSVEVSFGFTALACFFLFFPQRARWTYPVLMATAVIYFGLGLIYDLPR